METIRLVIYPPTNRVQQYMEESASIISMMCKKGILQLDPADVKEIVRGNYIFICIEGQGDYQKRFIDALCQIPLITYKRVLIQVEYNPLREPLFSEINLLTERFPPYNCSIGFSELSHSSRNDVVVVKILLSL